MGSQGAGGSNQGAGDKFVKFSRQSAQRIAKVVRTVEQGDRNQGGVVFDHPVPSQGLTLKLATFTGSWSTGTYKTVTLYGQTNTASVFNWCNPVAGGTSNTACSNYVIFGRVGGTNSVLEVQLSGTCSTCVMSIGNVDLTTIAGYSAGAIQLLGHSAADVTTNGTACASLTWYSVTTCATSTAA